MTEPAYNSTTSLSAIRNGELGTPCQDGWTKLLEHLGKTKADNEALPLLTVLESNGLDDALWVLSTDPELDRLARHFQAWCADQVLHIYEAAYPDDSRVRDQIAILRNDDATDEDRAAAGAAAGAAAWAAAEVEARAAARAAAGVAARAAARAAAGAAAGVAARAAAWDAAEVEARAAARAAQEKQLRKMIEAQPAPSSEAKQVDYIGIASEGFENWKAKTHNKKWFRRIDGTPIPNDLIVCIAGAFAAHQTPIHDPQPALSDTDAPQAGEAQPVGGSEAEWHPIETAPKDGTRVLVHSPETHSYSIIVARYCNTEGKWEEWGDYYPCEPTHWMPLPSAPDAPHADPTSQSGDLVSMEAAIVVAKEAISKIVYDQWFKSHYPVTSHGHQYVGEAAEVAIRALPAARAEVSVAEAARVLLGDGGMMPTPAKLAAVKAHLQRDSRVQPVAIIEAWSAALRALTEAGG